MEMWYTEEQTNNVRFSIRCDKQKYSAQSEYQRIEIFSTPEFGDVLVLYPCPDGRQSRYQKCTGHRRR